MPTIAATVAVLALSSILAAPASTGEDPEKVQKESRPTLVYVEPFRPGDEAVGQAELHLIARELFINKLAAGKKFNFSEDPQAEGVQMIVQATVSRTPEGPYRMEVTITQEGKAPVTLSVSDASLEALAIKAAGVVNKLRKRTGYVIKREGDRIVIARGSQDGISVGQRYRTTDTFEEFVITKVTTQTAEGRILGAPSEGVQPLTRRLATKGELGSVDFVFVIDTTGSMQEEIDGVLHNCERFASRLADKGIDARLGLVTFREGVEDIKEMTPDAEEFKGWVKPLVADGSAMETPFMALEKASTFDFRSDAVPIFMLITDEPAYDALENVGVVYDLREKGWRFTRGRKRMPAVEEIYESGIARRVLKRMLDIHGVVFSVTLNVGGSTYRYLSQATGGTYYDLELSQDFTALLDSMGEKIEGMFVETESSSAQPRSERSVAVPAAPRWLEKREMPELKEKAAGRKSYGALLGLSYLVAPLLGVGVGVAAEDSWGIGLLALLIPPAVHWAHGNIGRGFGSLGGQLGGTLLFGLIGFGVAEDGGVGGAIVGGIIGYIVWAIIDSAAFAYQEVPGSRAALAPTVVPSAKGDYLPGLAFTFNW